MAVHKASLRLIKITGVGVFTVGFLMSTTPDTIPAFLLLVPFLGMYIFFYLVAIEVVRFLGPDEDENGAVMHVRRPRLVSAVLSGFPVLLLVLQSVVELTWWDVVIATLMLLFVYVYISRGSLRRTG